MGQGTHGRIGRGRERGDPKRGRESRIGVDFWGWALYNGGRRGADNAFTLYEDAGDYSDYQNGAYAETRFTLDWGKRATFTVHPATGDLSLIPGTRTRKIDLRGFHRDSKVTVNCEGATVTRDPNTNTTVVLVTAPITATVTVTVEGETLVHDNADVMDRCRDVVLFGQIADKEKLMEIIRRKAPVRDRLRAMHYRQRAWDSVADVVGELLTLTEEENN